MSHGVSANFSLSFSFPSNENKWISLTNFTGRERNLSMDMTYTSYWVMTQVCIKKERLSVRSVAVLIKRVDIFNYN